MNAVLHTRPALPLAIAALALAVSAVPVVAQEIPFEEARLFFELNDTDGDLGIHSSIDGEPWKFLAIEDSSGRRLVSTTPTANLRLQGLTQFFFESAEYGFDELSAAAFFARFPEGIYEIEGTSLEGDAMESTVRLSHVLPGPPQNLRVNGLAVGENCDDTANIPTVSPPVIITWNAVTQAHPTLGRRGPVKVARYQVFAEQRKEDPLIFSLDLPPTMTSYRVAPELIALGDRQYKFEIQVRDVNGNQTAVENCLNVAR
jgi:hypothetical protein